MKPAKIFIAVPTYGGSTHFGTLDSILRTSLPRGTQHQIFTRYRGLSLLSDNFNHLWSEALNMYNEGHITHFAMVHSDISPQGTFLDTFLRIMYNESADIVSAVAPIKDKRGLSSTAIGHPTDDWRIIKRLTMAEVHSLPATFTARDCGYPDCPLLVNTGCWLCDLSKPWTRAVENGQAKFAFNIHSRILFDGKKYFMGGARPEDWEMSRHVWREGGRVVCTRAVELFHYGNAAFGNQSVWGTEKVDPLWDKDLEAQFKKAG